MKQYKKEYSMKKKSQKLIVFLSILVALMVLVGLCLETNLTTVTTMLSDKRTTLFIGQTDTLHASFTSGMREEPYEQDGKAKQMVLFGIVKARFMPTRQEQTLPFTLTQGETTLHGILEKSPYENAYYYDIEQHLNGQTDCTLTLQIAETETATLTLACLSCTWQVDADKAIELATKRMEALHAFRIGFLHKKVFGISSNDLESRLQLLSNDTPLLTHHFWHFSILSKTSIVFSCVIDPTSGQILAQT